MRVTIQTKKEIAEKVATETVKNQHTKVKKALKIKTDNYVRECENLFFRIYPKNIQELCEKLPEKYTEKNLLLNLNNWYSDSPQKSLLTPFISSYTYPTIIEHIEELVLETPSLDFLINSNNYFNNYYLLFSRDLFIPNTNLNIKDIDLDLLQPLAKAKKELNKVFGEYHKISVSKVKIYNTVFDRIKGKSTDTSIIKAFPEVEKFYTFKEKMKIVEVNNSLFQMLIDNGLEL